jgi:hypothetical protein
VHNPGLLYHALLHRSPLRLIHHHVRLLHAHDEQLMGHLRLLLCCVPRGGCTIIICC